MKERGALIAAVLVLFAGLGVWSLVAGRESAQLASVLLRPPTPEIGQRVPQDDVAATPDRALLSAALLGGLPLVRVLVRATVPVNAIVVSGRDAIAVRDRMRAVADSGRVPIVIGDGWASRAHAEAVAGTSDAPEAIVRRAATLDVDAILAARRVADEGDAGTARGAAEASERSERWVTVRDPQVDVWLPEVAVALLPASDPVEAPAWLAFGNWRGCPDPATHVAVLTRFRDRFGAEVVAIDGDTIELRVARPPTDAGAALALAREHVAYAPELVAGRTVQDVAAELVGARSWTFRWPRTIPWR